MPVDTVEHDGAVGDRSAEGAVGGEGLVGPQVLVPAVADDPRVVRCGGERDGAPHDLVVRRDVREVDFVQCESDGHEVQVRVDQPGEYGRVPEVQRLRPRRDACTHLSR